MVRAVDLSPSVRSLALELESGPLAFSAGQWVEVEVEGPGGLEKRAYSLANAPFEQALEIAVTRVEEGRVSPALHVLPEGSEVSVYGPVGFFTREGVEAEAPALFVATGTGLAPFRSMLRDRALRMGHSAPITLLFGCRSQPDILWREELEAMATAGQIRLEITLSRPGPGWTGRTGYVQGHVAELAREFEAPHVYICGLNHMVSEVRAVCKKELGLTRTSIHSERYD